MKKTLSKLLIMLLVMNLGIGMAPERVFAITAPVDSTLGFDLAPYVVQQNGDNIVVQFKVNRGSKVYYQAVTAGTPVTNETVMANGHYTILNSGNTDVVIFDDLSSGTAYDLNFVLFDPINTSVSAATPIKIANQSLYTAPAPAVNGLVSVGYVMTSYTSAHIYGTLLSPNTSATSITPALGDITITFNGQFPDSSTTKSLATTEYTIEPILPGSQSLVIEVLASAFDVGGTLYNFTVGTPEPMVLTINNANVFQPAITQNFSVQYEIGYNHLSPMYYPTMHSAEYVTDPGQDFVRIQLNDTVASELIPAANTFLVQTGQATISSSAYTVISDNITETSCSAIRLVFDPTTEATFRNSAQPSTSFTITNTDANYNTHMPPLSAVFYNPNYKADMSSDNTIDSLILFANSPQVMSATKVVNTNMYTAKVPYILFEPASIEKLRSAIMVVPTASTSYVQTMWDGNLLINVTAQDGSLASYSLEVHSDALTLGGLGFGGTAVSNFNPFQNPIVPYQINTNTPYTLATLPALTAVYDSQSGVQCTVSSPTALPGTGNFDYTITLSDGLTTPTTRTYHVYVLYSSGASAGDDDDSGSGGSLPIDIPAGFDPAAFYDPFKLLGTDTPPTSDQILQEINKLTSLMDSAQLANLESTMNNFETVFKSVTNNEQAFSTLNSMDSVLGKITFTQANTAANANAAKLAENLTLNTESKLLLIESPTQQLEVLTKFVDAAKTLQNSSTVPLVSMEQSIGEMLQKTANNFGTTQIKAAEAGAPVVVETKVIQDVIAKQVEGLKQLNALQQKFFDAGNQQALKPEIKLEVQTAEGSKQLQLTLQQEVVGILQAQKIDAVAISSQNVQIKVPVSNLRPSENTQILIEQRPAPVLRVPLPEPPKVVYEFAMVVNNNKQETFAKPITLSFELGNFGFANEPGNSLVIGRYNETLQAWQPVGGIVDPQSGVIFAKRDNLSQYTVLKSKKSFSDADNSWAKEEINAMLNKGIVSDAANFKPQSLLTRGEFAQWIANAYGLKVSEKGLPFKDVPKNSEYYGAIAAVYQQGILQGSKDKFNPDKPLTQNELASALGKVLVSFDNKQKSDKVTSKHLSALKTTQVASWAEDDMALLMELGMAVNAKSGATNITKEAAASAFMKFYKS